MFENFNKTQVAVAGAIVLTITFAGSAWGALQPTHRVHIILSALLMALALACSFAAEVIMAIVDLGGRSGAGTTAEGVETAEQLELVRREGCTEVQGYFFSKPLCADDARKFVSRGLPKEKARPRAAAG